MTINRDTARRYTARARAAALVLVAAAGAAIALPLPFLRPAPTTAAISTEAPATEDPAGAEDQAPPIDLDLAISTLWMIGPPPSEEPEPAAVANAAPTTPEPGKAAAPAVTPGGWRYIGNIMGPRGMHALLEREGRQRLVKVGDELDDARVTAVDAASVSIDDGSGAKQIRLAARSSRWTTDPAAATVPPPAASRPNIPNVPGMLTNRPGQGARPANVPPPRQYPTELTDEQRERYELERQEKLEKYRESGEDPPREIPEDGGSR